MRRVICLLFLLFFLFPINVHAYIIIFYRYEPVIYEISHRSIIIYDREGQKVGLIPQMSFSGVPQDFCAVIPTPTPPKINTVSRDAFYDVERLTSPVRRERGSGCFGGDIIGGNDDDDEAIAPTGIDIINEQSVGGYDAVTLSATDPDALISWLAENNYKYSVQDKETIDYYIQRGWVFTVLNIDIPRESAISEYYRYNLNPVLFRYSASSLVYPVRLASINSGDRTDIVTYVLSDTKMTFPFSRVEYANRIDEKELQNIVERYPAFGGLIGQTRYLTKLRRTFSIMEMDEDIEIVPAPDNEEFREVIYYGVSPAADFIPLGVVAAIFLIFRALSERKRDASERAPARKKD
jgi:hypothetical protein